MSRLPGRVAVAGLAVALSLTFAGCGNEQCQQLQVQFDRAEQSGAFSAAQATERKLAASGCYD